MEKVLIEVDGGRKVEAFEFSIKFVAPWEHKDLIMCDETQSMLIDRFYKTMYEFINCVGDTAKELYEEERKKKLRVVKGGNGTDRQD